MTLVSVSKKLRGTFEDYHTRGDTDAPNATKP